MANLSRDKRQRMQELLQNIRNDHEGEDPLLDAFGEMKSALNAKQIGSVGEQNKEAPDVQLKDQAPVIDERQNKKISANGSGSIDFLLNGLIDWD